MRTWGKERIRKNMEKKEMKTKKIDVVCLLLFGQKDKR